MSLCWDTESEGKCHCVGTVQREVKNITVLG